MKIELTRELIDNHADDNILIIGQYLSQLEAISKALGYLLITGKTKNEKREELYDEFKSGARKAIRKRPIKDYLECYSLLVDRPAASMYRAYHSNNHIAATSKNRPRWQLFYLPWVLESRNLTVHAHSAQFH